MRMSETGRIAAIVLAAGRSERMKYPKTLLIFGKETVVDRVIRICAEAGCDPVILVLGSEEERIRANASLEGAQLVSHPGFAQGRSSSLQAGLRALPSDAETFLLYPVDHALVMRATIAALIAAHRDSGRAITIPVPDGRRGHPIVCDRAIAEEFMALAPDAPAREVTGRDPARILEHPVEDAEVLRDLDTPADYHAALEVYSARGGEAGFLAKKGAGRPAPKRPPV